MRHTSRILFVLSISALPAAAIEPPVDPEPIPPRQPVEEVVPAPPVPPQAEVVPMPAVEEGRPYIGVILDPVPDILFEHLKLNPGQGLIVGEIVPGGPAEAAGLKVNDVIVEVAGEPVGSADQVRAKVAAHKVGDQVAVVVIHEGVRKEMAITLGQTPPLIPQAAPEDPAVAGDPLDGVLDNLPEQHADRIREALEKNLREFENLEEGKGLADIQREMMKRMQRQMGAGGMKMNFEFNAESTVRLLDDEGSIEMKSVDGHKEAKAYDKAGELLWEGPYDTEQDRAAVPDDIRKRLDRLNLDMNFEGNGLRLRLGPDRFRPLEEMDQVPEGEIPEPPGDE